jgi:hypothetical protein
MSPTSSVNWKNDFVNVHKDHTSVDEMSGLCLQATTNYSTAVFQLSCNTWVRKQRKRNNNYFKLRISNGNWIFHSTNQKSQTKRPTTIKSDVNSSFALKTGLVIA